MSDAKDTALTHRPTDRVNLAELEARIATTAYYRIGENVTICQLTLDNGFAVCGETTCVPGQAYNQFLGEKVARDRAVSQLWPFFYCLRAESAFRAKRDRR